MKRSQYFFLTIAAVSLFLASGVAHAATDTWKALVTSTWSGNINWSLGHTPASTDVALFSASSTKGCTINTTVNIAGIEIDSGYTGVVSQSSTYSVTLGASGFVQYGGGFAGGSDPITVTGPFTLAGGAFTSTSNTLLLNGSATTTFSGGTFAPGTGTVSIYGTNLTSYVVGSSSFNNLSIGDDTACSGCDTAVFISTGTVMSVAGTLSFVGQGGIDLESGEIDAQGDIDNLYSGSALSSPQDQSGGTALIKINGSGTQTLNGSSSLTSITLPQVSVSKSGGTLYMNGTTTIGGGWTYTQGTVNPGTSTIAFTSDYFNQGGCSGSDGCQTITGSSTFYNLTFTTPSSSSRGLIATIATGTVLKVENTLTTAGPIGVILNSGEVDAQGNIVINNTWESSGGTATVVVNGTTTQTVYGAPAVDEGYLPSFTVNKSAGTLYFQNFVGINGNWTVTAGTTNFGTSTVEFDSSDGSGNQSTIEINSSTTFANMRLTAFASYANLTVDIPSGVVVTASGTLTYAGSGGWIKMTGNELDVKGDIDLLNTAANTSSVATVVLNGTGSQAIVSSVALTQSSLGKLVINKASGVAYTSGNVTVDGTLSVESGELQLSSTTASSSFWVGGTITVDSGGMLSDYATASSTIYTTTGGLSGGVTNYGVIYFDGSGGSCGSSAPNDVILRSTVDGVQSPWNGSKGFFIMRYLDVKDQGGGTAPIAVLNGTDNGDNTTNWTFTTGQAIQLVQSASSTGTSGTTQLTVPFGFPPRAGDLIVVAVSAENQKIGATTDNASNTYTLVASTTFSSPTRALSMFYAKNVMTTSTAGGTPFTITVNGVNGSSGQLLSASAFEYAGAAPSTTLDTYELNSDVSGNATTLTSYQANPTSTNELYVGAATVTSTSTTVTPNSPWTTEAGIPADATHESLYTEDFTTSTLFNASATWTSTASTSYAAMVGLFRAPYSAAYPASGTVDSMIFDTGVTTGVNLNSLIWEGSEPNGTAVEFQIAVSNSSGGPWNFVGSDGTGNTYFTPSPGVSLNIAPGSNYGFFSGYRYFRYRATLFSDPAQTYTPTLNQVVVNWSP